MADLEHSATEPPAGPPSGIKFTKFQKGLLVFNVFLLGLNVYRWLAGLGESSRFENLRGVVLAGALVLGVGAGLVRRPLLQKVLTAVNIVLVLAWFAMFFAR